MALTVSVQEIVTGSKNPLLAIRPHWSRVRLGDVAEVLNGFAFKSSQFSRDEGMPLVRIRDVGSNGSDTKYIGEYVDRYLVRAGDLLVGMDGDFNCARWNASPALLNQRVCKVSVDPNVYLPRLLDYVLPAYLRAINDATSSVTVKHLSSRSIEDIPLPMPPMDEQRRIVEEIEKQFSRLDRAVANLHRVRLGLAAFRRASLQTTFDATADTTVKRLEDVCDVIAGYAFKSEDFAGAGVPVVKIANVGYGEFTSKDQAYLPSEFEARYQAFRIHTGDVLMALTRPVTGDTLKVCAYPAGAPPALLNQRVALLRAQTPVDARYLLALMHSPQFKRQVLGSVSQTLQPNLSPVDLRRFNVSWPPLDERERIVAEVDRRLSIVREVEAEVDANLKRAQALRQSVLQWAFSSAPAGRAAFAASMYFCTLNVENCGASGMPIPRKRIFFLRTSGLSSDHLK